jgi:hypothetical protein
MDEDRGKPKGGQLDVRALVAVEVVVFGIAGGLIANWLADPG